MSYECMGFVGKEMTVVGIGKSATSDIFEIKRGFEELERLMLSNPLSS